MELEKADDALTEAELERRICGIWQQVLGVEDLRTDDNFFEIGGHSLSASQIIAHIGQVLGAGISLSAFFDHPTVSEQVQLLVYEMSVECGKARP